MLIAVLGLVRLDAVQSAGVASAELPEGIHDFEVTVAGRSWDVEWVRPASLDRVPWSGPPLALGVDGDHDVGRRLLVRGSATKDRSRVGDMAVAGTLRGRVLAQSGAPDPVGRAVNGFRSHVLANLNRDASPGATLLAGFLIGEVGGVSEQVLDDLRRSGLSHFVAVSGSNVALFLAAWWVALGPLGWSPRRRAVTGLVGVAFFVLVTRAEPSVVRAGVMAGLVLAARLFGVAVSAWWALGWAVTVVLLAAPALVWSLGFQLSVLATLGVLIGTRVASGRRPRWLFTGLAATLGAQTAVAPLLLLTFGTVPSMAPVTNLVAAPLVGLSTAVGGVGAILGLGPLVAMGARLAEAVMGVARWGAGFPALSASEVAVVTAAGVAIARWRVLLVPLTVVAAFMVMSWVGPRPVPGTSQVTFFDVGQGDAALIEGASGVRILIDGGPDPRILRNKLAGVDRIDLVVVSHRHADHIGGLDWLPDQVEVGALWYPDQPLEESALGALVAAFREREVPVEAVRAGRTVTLGEFTLTVLGPQRRYLSPNDGSVVLFVQTADISVLFPGDVEEVAMADLGPIPATILKVPHQGSATSDLDWLAAVGAELAVVSVGPNTFGHPSPAVVEALEASGAMVRRTDRDGDVVVTLDVPRLATVGP